MNQTLLIVGVGVAVLLLMRQQQPTARTAATGAGTAGSNNTAQSWADALKAAAQAFDDYIRLPDSTANQ